ncbi:hypothetical protein MUK42_19695 [Musa troglodytarum]|uniref:Uncharacterized protein n=1 Tax=Musa troglodytarum TaxID=320322 RepID=A0A9E7G402_9LILI|nr:hypothetical protein MUK42_19695 [Musa troglodytarum]
MVVRDAIAQGFASTTFYISMIALSTDVMDPFSWTTHTPTFTGEKSARGWFPSDEVSVLIFNVVDEGGDYHIVQILHVIIEPIF